MALTAEDVIGSLGRWKINVLGQLSRILDQAIAVKDDAVTVAGRIRDYASPLFSPRRGVDGRLIQRGGTVSWPARPGMASAQLRRLMTVAVNEAHRDAVIATAGSGDFGVLWVLSAEHVNSDECDDIAEQDNGFGRGVYLPEDVPDRPHYGCLCIQAMIPLIAARRVA